MKNKKGFLLGEETVKIIIAIICIVVLVYFLASLYLANRNKDLGLAKASLEKLINDANAGRTETEIYNPNDWAIISFSSTENKPKFCLDKGWNNCICFCTRVTNPVIKSCSTVLGSQITCLESDFEVKGEGVLPTIEGAISINIYPPLFLSINQQDKTISKKR